MKQLHVKISCCNLIKVSTLSLITILILSLSFANNSFARESQDQFTAFTSLSKFTETILEKSFETLQFVWIKLNELIKSESGHQILGFLNTIKDKPMVLASALLMILSALFVIYRSRRIKAKQRRILAELKESMEDEEEEEDDYEEDRPLFPSPGQTENDTAEDDEVRPLLPADEMEENEHAEVVQSGTEESFTPDSTFSAKPFEPSQTTEIPSREERQEEDILKFLDTKQEEVSAPLKKETISHSFEEETDQDNILKKLEEEFVRLENEFQDVDTLRKEVTRNTPDEKDLSNIVSSYDETQGNDDDLSNLDQLEPMEKDLLGDDLVFTNADERPPQTSAVEDEEADQSFTDLREEMEQTIQELSEQLDDDGEENLFGTTTPELSSDEEPLTEKMLKEIDESSGVVTDKETVTTKITSQVEDTPESAPILEEKESSETAALEIPEQSEELNQAELQPSEILNNEALEEPPANHTPTVLEPESVEPQPTEFPIANVADEHPADNLEPVDPEPELPSKKNIGFNREAAHRQINHLVHFQRSLENQLDQMEIPSPTKEMEEEPPVKKEAYQEDINLEPAEQNYEQAKNSLKQKGFFDLLESFILLENQKKDD